MLYFLHGLNGYPTEWDRFIDYFMEKGYSCEAVDFMKGCDLRKTRFMDYVQSIASKVSHNDVVIGHSMGGLLMLKVAEKIPLQAGIGICLAPPQGFETTGISFNEQLRYVPNILFHIPFKPSFKLYRSLFVKHLGEPAAKAQYERLQKQSSVVTYEVMKHKIPVDASKISCPLLLIATEDDPAIPASMVESVAASYHATFKLYQGDHYIFNRWEKIAKGIYDFLKEKDIN
jgi:esterase/lipase